jgi:hypothetical protein
VTPKATLGETPVNVQGRKSTSPGTTVPKTPITTRNIESPATLIPSTPSPHTTLRDAWSNERAVRNRILQSEGGTQEYIVPDSIQDRPRPLKPLFAGRSPVKNIVHKIPKQKDIKPLLKIIRQKVMSDFHINVEHRDLKLEQRKDPLFKGIYRYLTDGILPASKAEASTIKNQVDDHFLIKDILFRLSHATSKREARLQICIPATLVPQILELHHNEILAGHNGVSNTIETLKVRYYFKGMYQMVKDL